MEFSNLGLHSARSSTLQNPGTNECLIPIGKLIRKWEVEPNSGELVLAGAFEALRTGDLILNLLTYNDHIIAASYNATFTVFKDEKIVHEIQAEGMKMTSSSCNQGLLAGTCELIDNQDYGCLNIWDCLDPLSITLIHRIYGKIACCVVLEDKTVFYIEFEEIFSENKKTSKVYHYNSKIYNTITKETTELQDIGILEDVTTIEEDKSTGNFIVVFLGGSIKVFDKRGIECFNLKVNVKGSIITAIYTNNILYFSIEDGGLTQIDMQGLFSSSEKSLTLEEISSFVISHKVNERSVHRLSSFLYIHSLSPFCIISGDEEALYFTNFEIGLSTEKQLISLAVCGVGISPDQKHVAVGDLLGNITVFENLSFEQNTQYKLKLYTGEGVRSLRWLNDDILVVGGMQGGLRSIHLQDSSVEAYRVGNQALDGTITTIRVRDFHQDNQSIKQIMCSTIEGKIYIFNLKDGNLTLVSDYTFHHPGTSCSSFGSLRKCWQ